MAATLPGRMVASYRSFICSSRFPIKPAFLRCTQLSAAERHKSTVAQVLPPMVQRISGEDHAGMLHVHWINNRSNRFPYIYLRDSCQCPKCFNGEMYRSFESFKALELDVKPNKLEASSDGSKITIEWSDEHVSEYSSHWLHNQRLPEKEDLQWRMKLNGKGKIFWDRSKLQGKIPRFLYHDIMREDEVLYDWLHTLDTLGLALVQQTPELQDPIAVERLVDRVGFLKSTHYGHTFDVFAKYDANNLAYTTGFLPFHCDIPQSEYYPGIQFLHCIEQAPTDGGNSIFVDGFHIAQELKETSPKLFDLMCKVPVPYIDIGKDIFGDFHLKNQRPTIELNDLGQIMRFTYNNHVRDYHMSATPEVTKQTYQALLTLGKMMRDPANMIEHKLAAGEIATFNNSRVLHGRLGYKVTSAGNRHLQGCYMDWDLVHARLRSLDKKLRTGFYN